MSRRIARKPKDDTSGNNPVGLQEAIDRQREKEKGMRVVRVDSRTYKLVKK